MIFFLQVNIRNMKKPLRMLRLSVILRRETIDNNNRLRKKTVKLPEEYLHYVRIVLAAEVLVIAVREIVETREDPENSKDQEEFCKQNLNDLLVPKAENKNKCCFYQLFDGIFTKNRFIILRLSHAGIESR